MKVDGLGKDCTIEKDEKIELGYLTVLNSGIMFWMNHLK